VRLAPGLIHGIPLRDQVVDVMIDMRPHFAGALRIETATVEEAAHVSLRWAA
jgi:hypothetical protein